jgi:hypothetical protein
MPCRVVLSIAALLMLAASPSLAETKIVSAALQRVQNGPPFKMITGIPRGLKRDGITTVGDGALAANTIYAFPEQQGVTLTSALRPGNGPSIAAGTRVDSFYVCVDTADGPSDPGPRNGAEYSAVVRFDNADLLGVVLRPPQLAASAAALGKPGVEYASSRYVGVDPFWMGQDAHNFSGGAFRFYGDANGIDCRRLIFRAKG